MQRSHSGHLVTGTWVQGDPSPAHPQYQIPTSNTHHPVLPCPSPPLLPVHLAFTTVSLRSPRLNGCFFPRPLRPVSQVLLVHEYGMWTMSGGAVDQGEAAVDTMKREVWEETGVHLDSGFQPVCVGGWNQPRARDNTVNDHYLCFVVKASSKEFQVDGEEIVKAKWVAIDFMLDLLRSQFGEAELASPPSAAGALKGKRRGLEHEGELYSEVMLWFLNNHRRGRSLGLLQRRAARYGVDRYYML